MKGKHHILIETSGLKYEFDIKRNITVIQGDSATGKTTLVELLNEYTSKGTNRGIHLEADVNCEIFSGPEARWKYTLDAIKDSVVIIDEDYHFVFSKEFAEYIHNSSNYYVIITRKPLKNLPYSIEEIYGIRTSGKYHFPEQVYHEFYPIYSEYSDMIDTSNVLILVEDKEAGYQFYNSVVGNDRCISAEGNAKIYAKMIECSGDNNLLIIADGAAFGAYVDNIVKYRYLKKHIALYFPESFEWLILKSNVLDDNSLKDILSHPEDYIDSSEYISWERYFTNLLISKTENDRIKGYSKTNLPAFYSTGKNASMILNNVPEEIRKLLK